MKNMLHNGSRGPLFSPFEKFRLLDLPEIDAILGDPSKRHFYSPSSHFVPVRTPGPTPQSLLWSREDVIDVVNRLAHRVHDLEWALVSQGGNLPITISKGASAPSVIAPQGLDEGPEYPEAGTMENGADIIE